MDDSRRSQDLISIHEGDSVGLEKHERTLRRDRQINQVAGRSVTFLDKTPPKTTRSKLHSVKYNIYINTR